MKKHQPLTVVIEVKDKQGRVVGRKEVATYHGLLAKAHDEGLRRIDTEIVQAPSKDNGETAIVRAKVTTNKGTFTGIGDASPGNVNRRIASHLLRMAETRAKARALRDAVNIGTVALEELGELLEDDATYEGGVQPSGNGAPRAEVAPPRPEAPPTDRKPVPFPSHGDNAPMTDSQRRFLFRLLLAASLPRAQYALPRLHDHVECFRVFWPLAAHHPIGRSGAQLRL